MQDQMGQVKETLQNTLIQGNAGGGLVSVTINGEKDLKKDCNQARMRQRPGGVARPHHRRLRRCCGQAGIPAG